MNCPRLSRFTCQECNEDFYMQMIGKPLNEVAQVMTNMHCPRCQKHTKMTIHMELVVAVPNNSWKRPIDRELIYADIDKERNHQDTKHPVFPASDYERYGILSEEVGELAQVLNHLKELNLTPAEYSKRLHEELNDVIGVGVRWREALDKEGH